MRVAKLFGLTLGVACAAGTAIAGEGRERVADYWKAHIDPVLAEERTQRENGSWSFDPGLLLELFPEKGTLGIYPFGYCRGESMCGFFVNGLALCSSNLTGVAVSGLVNGNAEARGLTIAALGNLAVSFGGVAVSGLCNCQDDGCGLSAAGLGNVALSFGGVQIGIFNRAEEMYGVQIGVLNDADSLHGVQVGLLNFADNACVSALPVVNWAF